MYCKVRNCIYNERGTCRLDETEINENGECEWIDCEDELQIKGE